MSELNDLLLVVTASMMGFIALEKFSISGKIATIFYFMVLTIYGIFFYNGTIETVDYVWATSFMLLSLILYFQVGEHEY